MKFIKRLFTASITFTLKLFTHILYRSEVNWVGNNQTSNNWDNCRIFIFINHTSLYEFLFIKTFTWRFVWKAAAHLVIPAASKTIDKPVLGIFFKALMPRLVSISRKRDHTWDLFLNNIDQKSIIAILPEGRMMRGNGLDSTGNPMSIKGGVVDILSIINDGNIVIAYSGGLHHIQTPEKSKLPKLFKTIKINYESIPVTKYKSLFNQKDPQEFKKQIIADLEFRKSKYCPID